MSLNTAAALPADNRQLSNKVMGGSTKHNTTEILEAKKFFTKHKMHAGRRKG